MKIETIAPSFLFFISGVMASASVNIVTAIPTTNPGFARAIMLLLCALPWLAAAAVLASVASMLESTRLECERLTSSTLTSLEVEETWKAVFNKVRRRVMTRMALVIVFVIIAVVTVIALHQIGQKSNLAELEDSSGQYSETTMTREHR